MRQGEEDALKATKVRVAEAYESTMAMCREFDRMDEQMLHNCGQRKGKDAAIANEVRNTLKNVDGLWKEFLRKFPD